jgi:hypothetical protein
MTIPNGALLLLLVLINLIEAWDQRSRLRGTMARQAQVRCRTLEVRALAGSSLLDELEYFLVTWMASEWVQLGIVLGPILLFVTEVWQTSFQQIESLVDVA